jgi:uncharacterized phage-associated protein
MTNIYNLANAFLSIEPMTNKKLQKLCYYAKAWHLALYDENIINEPFEAWVHGPVNRALYEKYKSYDPSNIEKETIENPEAEFAPFIQHVYAAYGHLDGDDLEVISHKEKPWIEARADKQPWESCDTIISEDTMKSFYKDKYKYAV